MLIYYPCFSEQWTIHIILWFGVLVVCISVCSISFQYIWTTNSERIHGTDLRRCSWSNCLFASAVRKRGRQGGHRRGLWCSICRFNSVMITRPWFVPHFRENIGESNKWSRVYFCLSESPIATSFLSTTWSDIALNILSSSSFDHLVFIICLFCRFSLLIIIFGAAYASGVILRWCTPSGKATLTVCTCFCRPEPTRMLRTKCVDARVLFFGNQHVQISWRLVRGFDSPRHQQIAYLTDEFDFTVSSAQFFYLKCCGNILV